MKKKDQILLEEAYQKVLEDYARFGDSDKLQLITPDNVDKITTDRQRDPEWEKTWEQDRDRLKKKWIDIRDFSDLVSLINKNEQKAKLEFGIYNLRNLKPGDKKSQEFISSLAKKDLQIHYELFKLVDPDKILKGYRSYVDPGLRKQDAEREELENAKNLKERSTFNKQSYNDTIEKLQKIGFKKAGSMIRDEEDVAVRPMSKTIGGFLSGRTKETITVYVNPNGSINKQGNDYDTWYNLKGKRYANAKKGLF